jgi:hypothetical protein
MLVCCQSSGAVMIASRISSPLTGEDQGEGESSPSLAVSPARGEMLDAAVCHLGLVIDLSFDL